MKPKHCAFLRDSGGRLWSASKSNHVRIYAPDGNLEGYLSKQGDIIKEQAHFFEDIYDFMEDQSTTYGWEAKVPVSIC